MTTATVKRGGRPGRPWQLQLFDRTLKKRQKLAMLLEMLGPLDGRRCLLVTGGDNNGAINHHLRAAGGSWSWAELEARSIDEMSRLLGEPVRRASAGRLPFGDRAFDRVAVIDVHEHLPDIGPFNREIARVLEPGGVAIVTTPNGDTRLPVARLKRLVGMGPEEYGHSVQGYRTADLEAMLRRVGLRPERTGAYARFFTEVAELAINFGYVKILSRRRRGPGVEKGTIAPGTADQLEAVRRTYRAYRLVYPAVRAFSALDAMVPGDGGYAVAVAARKDA